MKEHLNQKVKENPNPQASETTLVLALGNKWICTQKNSAGLLPTKRRGSDLLYCFRIKTIFDLGLKHLQHLPVWIISLDRSFTEGVWGYIKDNLILQ